jgi:hypothetical protein
MSKITFNKFNYIKSILEKFPQKPTTWGCSSSAYCWCLFNESGGEFEDESRVESRQRTSPIPLEPENLTFLLETLIQKDKIPIPKVFFLPKNQKFSLKTRTFHLKT